MARRCKFGKLKSPSGRRVCKKRPRRGRRPAGASRCKYGKLKSPSGGRVCKKRPSRGRTYRSRSRKPAGMARRGSKCLRFKRVRVRTSRGIRVQRRCAKFRAR